MRFKKSKSEMKDNEQYNRFEIHEPNGATLSVIIEDGYKVAFHKFYGRQLFVFAASKHSEPIGKIIDSAIEDKIEVFRHGSLLNPNKEGKRVQIICNGMSFDGFDSYTGEPKEYYFSNNAEFVYSNTDEYVPYKGKLQHCDIDRFFIVAHKSNEYAHKISNTILEHFNK